MKIVDRIALVLVIIGALNWGGVGLFSFDCVAFLFVDCRVQSKCTECSHATDWV